MRGADPYDLLIVGGGINGAGIARDAAGRGFSVALIEQDDLASHTSSASTKLIHGGLRYLEHGEFRLVRESLSERERLLAIAPHLISPMRFLLPHVEGLRPRWQIRMGLWLYDHAGGREKLPASCAVRIAGSPWSSGLQPQLDRGFLYSDCWVDDARLVVLNALDARERGAAIHTRLKVLEAKPERGQWTLHCANTDTRQPVQLQGRMLINASGAWVTRLLSGIAGLRANRRLRLIKGSHIIVPRLYEGEHALLLQNIDQRVVFAIPYEQRYTLVGTTDIPFDADPAQVHISPEETQYLCDAANRFFVRQLAPKDVFHSYSGVRALFDDAASDPSAVTRDYELELDRSADGAPVLSVFGGKITTYRKLAEAALEQVLETFELPADPSRVPWTAELALPGGDVPRGDFDLFFVHSRARWPWLPDATLRRLARLYGTRMSLVLGSAKDVNDLGVDFGAGLARAEVDYLVTREWARSSDDILWRRTKLGLQFSTAQVHALRTYLNRA
ncbi:MAG: glycerol-3-phosphate dehydrogenase [Steroidobacteraceae bacterium]